MLASGSKDCDIILWDAVSEAGLFRLQGHRDQVLLLLFLLNFVLFKLSTELLLGFRR